jgi:hypothetical protein
VKRSGGHRLERRGILRESLSCGSVLLRGGKREGGAAGDGVERAVATAWR